MLDETTVMRALRRHWEYEGKDHDISHEIFPAALEFHVRRITVRDDLAVAENLISYDGKPWMFSVNLLQFRGDKVEHERSTSWTAGKPPSGAPLGGRRPPQIRHRHLRSSAGIEPRRSVR